MTASSDRAGFDPGAEAARATDAILHDTLYGAYRGVVVDSPPGAGKSTLVVRAALELAAAGRPLMVVAQTNAQVDDLVTRLAEKAPDLPVGKLHSNDPDPYDPSLNELASVRKSAKAADLAGLDVVVSTAAKWAHVQGWSRGGTRSWTRRTRCVRTRCSPSPGSSSGRCSWATRASWTRSAWSARISGRVCRTTRRRARSARSSRTIPNCRSTGSRCRGGSPASAAPLVSDAFYPYTPFRSGTGPADQPAHLRRPLRRLGPGPRGGRGGGLRLGPAGARRPGVRPVRTPRRYGQLPWSSMRLLDRGGATTGERGPGTSPLTADRVAVGTAHRDQAAAIRAALAELGVTGVAVDTANRLQGREFDVTVVLHPLSGRPDATAFHLETGRLCVLTSRHRHACIVICRAGVPELLDEHPSTEPVQLGVTIKFPDGWEANHAVLSHLSEHRITWQP